VVSHKKKLVQKIVDLMFDTVHETILRIPTESHRLLIEMINQDNSKELVESALNEVDCRPCDFYGETSEIHHQIIQLRIIKNSQMRIISRYDSYDGKEDQLIRGDFQRENGRDVYLRMLLNQESIKNYLLSDDVNAKKDSNFEKLCAILLKVKYQCKQVGILRETPAKDGGLDFFGIRQPQFDDSKPEFIFGQAKRRNSINNKDVNDFLKQWADGFVPMVQKKNSYVHYVLCDGTSIQKKLVEKVPELFDCVTKPMMVCVGLIPKTQIAIMDEHPNNAITIFGLELIQQLCISISKSDPQGFNSWFEGDFPHKFIPNSFDEWLEGQLGSLIIVDEKN